MTEPPYPRLLPLGDAAVTVVFGDRVDPALNGKAMALAAQLRQRADAGTLRGVQEWVPAFASVTVHLDDRLSADEIGAIEQDLLACARTAAASDAAGRAWRLPVCFDADLAPDLEGLARTRGLTVDEVKAALTGTRFRVYMLGFLPGFPYMGDLPAACEVPRLSTPRARVPERSVAVAGRLCAVYPWASPGGWHLLGRTPVRLFDPAQPEPALLRAGDTVQWQPVDRATYDRLDADAAAGRLPRETWHEPPSG